MNSENFSERLRLVLDGEPVNSFSKKCGVSESLLRKYLSGSCPGFDKVTAIATAANIDINWLATGEGPMYRGKTSEQVGEITLNEGGVCQENQDIDELGLVKKTINVLRSNTIYRPALAANINAFNEAVEQEMRVKELENKIVSMDDRLAALEKKSAAKESGPEKKPEAGVA